jgi:hypothetical protein
MVLVNFKGEFSLVTTKQITIRRHSFAGVSKAAIHAENTDVSPR